jgi:putative transport protein
MSALLGQDILVLFAILTIGSWIGQLSIKGLSLGTAGVLFAALIFGHFGFTVPKGIMDLGLLLFVYAVGLQAGPRFFRTFQRHGIQYVIIAVVTVGVGALATVAVAYWLKLPPTLASGLYTGALTCTPALAAAVDAVERISPGASANVSVGYGIAYPFGMIGIVLLVQFLPRLLRRNLHQEEAAWLEQKSIESPSLEARQYRVSNPNCDGKKVSEINPRRMSLANISRIKRGDRVFAARPDFVLQVDDVVMVVGAPEELGKMSLLLGEETSERMDVNADLLSVDVEVTEADLAGKKLAEMRVWELYTVVITRIRRQGLEIVPTGDVALELGDNLRVVGDRAAVESFVTQVHKHPQKAEETNMLPFLTGLLLGVILGSVPINLSNGIQVKLGTAGGAFLVSLLVGHFGGIGPLRLYVPVAAKNLSRELGLMLFLAGAGTTAGAHFVQVLQQQGISLFIGGALITILSTLAGLLLMARIYHMNLLSMMGALTACMTNPPGLGAVNAQTEIDLPTLSYASVYPVALIFKIVLAQILVGIFMRFF